jgi:replicative DNA helicase
LRRSADEANRKPRLSDLRESGSLEQDCDLCLMLWRKDDDPDKTKITVAKQRNGRCGTVDVQFKPSIQKFLPNPILN